MKKYQWYFSIVMFLLVVGGIAYLVTQTNVIAKVSSSDVVTNENATSEGHDTAVTVVDQKTKKILYWTCVMHPTVHMPGPGLCPVCGMDLIPVYEGAGLTLSEQQKDLIPIKTEEIGFHRLSREIRAVGTLDYNEKKIAYASTRVSGWIQELHVNFTGTNVKQGEQLLDIYSPDLLVAQEEYLLTIKNQNEMQKSNMEVVRQTSQRTVEAAESRLELLGLTKQQIQEIREYGKTRNNLPLYAPIGGTVIHMNVYKGDYVNRGMNLYKIADLSSLWLLADVYEYEMSWISLGQDTIINVQSMPEKEFHGKVIFIYPYMDTKSRTLKVQIEVPNPAGELRPGMYANVRLKSTLPQIYAQKSGIAQTVSSGSTTTVWTCPMHPQVQEKGPGECPICGMTLVKKKVSSKPTTTTGIALRSDAPPIQFGYICPSHPDQVYAEPGKCYIDGKRLVMTDKILSVPKSAVIDTGIRTIVFVDKGTEGYKQVDVKLGPEVLADEGDTQRRYFPIIGGLFAGDRVVTNGNYLLDSQSELTGSGSVAKAFGGAIGKESPGSNAVPAHQH